MGFIEIVRFIPLLQAAGLPFIVADVPGCVWLPQLSLPGTRSCPCALRKTAAREHESIGTTTRFFWWHCSLPRIPFSPEAFQEVCLRPSKLQIERKSQCFKERARGRKRQEQGQQPAKNISGRQKHRVRFWPHRISLKLSTFSLSPAAAVHEAFSQD